MKIPPFICEGLLGFFWERGPKTTTQEAGVKQKQDLDTTRRYTLTKTQAGNRNVEIDLLVCDAQMHKSTSSKM